MSLSSTPPNLALKHGQQTPIRENNIGCCLLRSLMALPAFALALALALPLSIPLSIPLSMPMPKPTLLPTLLFPPLFPPPLMLSCECDCSQSTMDSGSAGHPKTSILSKLHFGVEVEMPLVFVFCDCDVCDGSGSGS